jgi:hypothetical protein
VCPKISDLFLIQPEVSERVKPVGILKHGFFSQILPTNDDSAAMFYSKKVDITLK